MSAWGIIVAAGAGTRFGAGDGIPKAFRPLAGLPMYLYALRAFEETQGIEGVSVVVPVNWLEHALSTVVARASGVRLELRQGGSTRTASVRAALAAVPSDADPIVVHDAARPLVDPALIARSMAQLAEDGDADGAVCAIPLADTLKRTEGDRIVETVPRGGLWRAQTPQAFRAPALRRAHARAERDGIDATDDAALVEATGGTVVLVRGDERNLKVTTREDLALAEALVRMKGEE